MKSFNTQRFGPNLKPHYRVSQVLTKSGYLYFDKKEGLETVIPDNELLHRIKEGRGIASFNEVVFKQDQD